MLARPIRHGRGNDAGGEAIKVSPRWTGHAHVHGVAMIQALVGSTGDLRMRRHHHASVERIVQAHVGITTVHRIMWWLAISWWRALPSPVCVGVLAVEAGRPLLTHWCSHAHGSVMRGRVIVGVVPIGHSIRVAVRWGHLAVAAVIAPVHQRHVPRTTIARRVRRR